MDDEGLSRKIEVIDRALDFHAQHLTSPEAVLARLGGLEIAMMAGGMMEAGLGNTIIMIDGFISTAACLAACKMDPRVRDNCIFCTVSGEGGHRRLLDYLKAQPLLNLGMRLGEGSGAALAYPVIKNAVAFFNEMASFESAGVSGRG
jgi:nicotinate-nucleotide--dimethylbenzimidazole phosphoribosyltransferase